MCFTFLNGESVKPRNLAAAELLRRLCGFSHLCGCRSSADVWISPLLPAQQMSAGLHDRYLAGAARGLSSWESVEEAGLRPRLPGTP